MKIRILCNSAKFSAGRPLLSAYNFSATVATTYSTYLFGAVASVKFLAIESMPPLFSAHVCCGQTGGWVKIPPGTELHLGPGDIILDGDPAPPPHKGAQQSPTFRPTALARIPASPHFSHNPYCRQGSARRAAVVALLPDNCQPSSW